MTQEQSILSKIVTVFAAKEIILQHNVLGYSIDAYFFKYIDYEMQRQKAIENELGCEFIRINPAKENFNIFVEIGKIQDYITKSTKKLTGESSKKSLIDFQTNY